MGAWYESILVKTNEPDTIRRVLHDLTTEGNRRFLVGPALDGWISIFPNNYGTNGEVATAISQQLRFDVFHFMVSDDDSFIYYFHRGGTLIDQYNSCPDYFEEVSDSQRNECVGRPHLFRDLFKMEELFNEFAVLLKAEEGYAFEQERMSKALDLLGLSNALSSYEYLQEGERYSVRDWNKFVHIPDLAAEKKAKRAAAALLKAEKKQLQKEGILLAEIGPSKKSKQQLASTIAWGVDYLNGGILLTMQDYHFTKAIDDPEYAGELRSLAPPWNGPAQPAGLKTNWTIGVFSMSPSGDWLAGGFAAGDWTARVWDWRRKTLHFEVPHTRAVQWVRFSHDSQYLFSLGGEEFAATSITEKRSLVTIKGLAGARSAAVHPSGTFAVVALQDHLEILDLDRQAIVNRLWMNRGMETIDPFENNRDALISVCLKEFLQHEKIREKLGITAELRAELLKDSNAIGRLNPEAREKLNAMLEDVRRRSRISFESKEAPFDVQFHPNGEKLFVASKGIRVYDWNSLLTATQDAPPPLLSVDAPRDDKSDPNSRPLAYCVRFDPERNLVLSGCLAGVVQYLNLATGKSGVLLKAAENMSIWRLELTSDNQAICCHCNTQPKIRPRSVATSYVQVWNYPALCRAAGVS